jgi:hypothetical protein
MILINLFCGIRGTFYEMRGFETYAVWYAHPFHLDDAANSLNGR